MIFEILKDIRICYDGIHPIELKKGEGFDLKDLIPNPEKAEKFHARLVGLGVVGTEPIKADKEIDTNVHVNKEYLKEEADKKADKNLDDMTKKELQSFLGDMDISFEGDANKKRLIELAREALG